MMIVKLGKWERWILDCLSSGDRPSLTGNQKRAIQTLERKGLIERSGDWWRKTDKCNVIALSQAEKNKIRNQSRTAHKLSKVYGSNATYFYQTRRATQGIGGDSIKQAMTSGILSLPDAIALRKDIDHWQALMDREGIPEETIENEIQKLISQTIG